MLIRLAIFPILGIFFIASGMVFSVEVRAETKRLLEPAPDFKASPAFRSILKAESGTGLSEIRKIEYLLERISRSNCIFIRNKQEHKGEIAALHMRWKYARYQKEVKTAGDFARKVADGSRKTREDYTIRMPDGCIYSSTEILLNELAALDEIIEMEHS